MMTQRSFDPHQAIPHFNFPDRHSSRCRRQVRRQAEQIGPRLPRLTLAFPPLLLLLLLDNIVQSSECCYPSYPNSYLTLPPTHYLTVSSNPCFTGLCPCLERVRVPDQQPPKKVYQLPSDGAVAWLPMMPMIRHSLILSREGLILTLSILPCPQGWIS